MRLTLLLTFALSTYMTGFNNNTDARGKAEVNTMISTIKERPFGMVDGKPVTEYTLTNKSGIAVSIINYGGIITKLMMPDKSGKLGDVVLGYDSLSGYLQNGNPYVGALIGRYGNRIAHAKFMLDGKAYTLAANNNGNTLHGGLKGFDKVWWDIKKEPGDSSLSLSYISKDGEEGFPGNLSVNVVYTLTAENALRIQYTAQTDKPTPVNLTNHTYFNLSAGKDSTILAHSLTIDAAQFTEVDDVLIPTGKLPAVKDGPMDFNTSKVIGKEIQLVKGGYDHNWVLNKQAGIFSKAATLDDAGSGRRVEVWTTEPGIQFYSGNFLNGSLTNTKKGQRYVKHAGLCLETQHFPDSPNQPAFPTTILKPGEMYSQLTEYRFGIVK